MRRFLFLAAAALVAVESVRGQAARPLKEYRDYALRRDGDVGRGRALFGTMEKAACAACHTVDGVGGKAGPDLSAIGDEFSRLEVIDAILEPSAKIAVGYEATIVETNSGETFYGVLKQSNAEAVALMGADGKLVRVPKATIKAQRGSPVSLMPEGLHAGISITEFADLVEYLVSLKQPENSLRAHQGMPEVIPELANPVALRPLFDEALRFPATVVRKSGDARTGLVWFGALPGSRETFLAVQQTGRVWRMDRSDGIFSKSLFADFSAEVYSQRGPNGLLGLAFHPKFGGNRKYYLKHQVFEGGQIATALVERRATVDGRADSGEPSRRLLTIPCVTQNHTGGCIAFGPDGMLYLGMGDTGPQQDPNGHGQDLRQLLGKMLRIDVDHRDGDLPYAIPVDNPFRGRADARSEIWAFGFREPWRFSFDRANGDLWVGDVGQDRVEEVAIVRRGENHGWNVYEGFEPFSNQRKLEGAVYAPPVAAYKRRYGNSVTGGFVYRGDQASSFYGVYVFGDFTSRRIWGLTQEGGRLTGIQQIALSPEGIASFATDGQGNIYVVGYEGMVYQLDIASAVFAREQASVGAKPPLKSVSWERRSFPLPESIWSVAALDANANGLRDLVAMGVTKVFALTAPDWKQETIFDAKEGKMLYCVALDANGDGASDLAVGRYQIPWIEYRDAQAKGKTLAAPTGPDFSVAWLENPRRAGAAWPLHVVDRELNGIHGLAVGDVDADGRPDLIADSISEPFFPNSLAWFSLGGKNSAPAVRHIVTQNGADGRPHYLDFADLSHDGRGDVLVGDSGKGTFTWWERGANDVMPWTKHLIAQEKGATNIKAGDVNGDGCFDVVGACGHGKGVFWFEGPAWTKHAIDAELATPHALAVGDFDSDGDLDVAVASYTAYVVRWYENDGRGNFTPHDMDVGHQQQAYDLKAADLDGDGRIDLILAGRETRNAVVYFNRK